jgi:SAM-dependent methyltransferase
MLNSIYDAHPQEYDALRSCWLNERRRSYIHKWLAGEVCRRGALRVLELGSGTGWLLGELARAFPECCFMGVEPLESYVEYSRKRAQLSNLVFIGDTAEAFQQPPGWAPFDVVLSNDMLHHVASLRAVVANVTKSVSRSAQWLLIEPNCVNPYTFVRQATLPGERNFWPRQFLRTASAAGWSPLRRDYLFLIPPFVRNPPLAARALERRIEWIPFLAGGVAVVLGRTCVPVTGKEQCTHSLPAN